MTDDTLNIEAIDEVVCPVQLADLEEAALLRPAGYLDDCRAMALSEEEGMLIFSPESYAALADKYRDYTPTLAQKLAGLTRSVSRWITAGMPLSERALIEHRQAICGGCEFWSGWSCQRCGCTGLKWGMLTEKCPEKRW